MTNNALILLLKLGIVFFPEIRPNVTESAYNESIVTYTPILELIKRADITLLEDRSFPKLIHIQDVDFLENDSGVTLKLKMALAESENIQISSFSLFTAGLHIQGFDEEQKTFFSVITFENNRPPLYKLRERSILVTSPLYEYTLHYPKAKLDSRLGKRRISIIVSAYCDFLTSSHRVKNRYYLFYWGRLKK